MSEQKPVSVIVLVDERPEPLGELYEEMSAPFRAAGIRFEFLFLIEPIREAHAAPLEALVARGEPVRRLLLAQQVPESALARLAAEEAYYDTLLVMPGYRRVAAEALPVLAGRIARGVDVAVARREPRREPRLNLLRARIFHLLLNRFSPQPFTDIGSGVMAMRREVMNELPLHGEFFRFLPVLAAREGFNVREVGVAQHPADQHIRRYPPGTYLRRLVDMLGLFFIIRFTDRPLRFFGAVGSVLGVLGSIVLLVLFIQRMEGIGIANRPILLLGLLLFVLGIQAVALGLVAEIIVHLGSSRRRSYRLREPPEDDAPPAA